MHFVFSTEELNAELNNTNPDLKAVIKIYSVDSIFVNLYPDREEVFLFPDLHALKLGL